MADTENILKTGKTLRRNSNINYSISVDTSEIDQALEKAQKLADLSKQGKSQKINESVDDLIVAVCESEKSSIEKGDIPNSMTLNALASLLNARAQSRIIS